ncbi:carbonic anhydrase [Bacteroidota bacterium]
MKIFATAINCIDGRTQLAVIEYLRTKYLIDYVDMVTEPGPIKILTEGINKQVIDNIKARVDMSIKKHNSKLIVVVGHFDCAANPEPKKVQVEQIKQSIYIVKQWWPDVPVTGLWIDENMVVHKGFHNYK